MDEEPSGRPGAVSSTATGPAVGNDDVGAFHGDVERARTGRRAESPGPRAGPADREPRERLGNEFLAQAAHELRNTVNSVLGSLEATLDDEIAALAPRHRQYLLIADRNAKRLWRLAEDLLVIESGEARRLGLKLGEVDMSALVKECAESAQQSARKSGVALVALSEVVPVVLADSGRLAQVVDNLLSNALKFTPPPGWVAVAVSARHDEVEVRVKDTGMGIDPQDLPNIFEPFYLRPGGGRQIPGSGLGLAVSRAIVEAHGGRIWAESGRGSGSTFRFTVPLAKGGDAGPG